MRIFAPEPLEALTFGYALYTIWDDEIVDLYYYLRIGIVLCVLILIKSPAIILCVICVAILLLFSIRKPGKKRALIITSVAPFVFLGAWKIYCYSFNLKSYLHVDSLNAAQSGAIKQIWSKVDVIGRYLWMFVTEPMNGGNIGITPLMAVLVMVLPIFLLKKQVNSDFCVKYKEFIRVYCIGIFVYCCGHLYMYLFVFSQPDE